MSLFVKKNGKIYGPFTADNIQACVGQSIFSVNNQISDDRLAWITISEYQERVKDKEAAESVKADAPALKTVKAGAPALKPVAGAPVLKPVAGAPVLKPVAGAPVLKPVGPAMQNPAPMMRNMMPQGQPVIQPGMRGGALLLRPHLSRELTAGALVTFGVAVVLRVIGIVILCTAKYERDLDVLPWLGFPSMGLFLISIPLGLVCCFLKSSSLGQKITCGIVSALSILALLDMVIGLLKAL